MTYVHFDRNAILAAMRKASDESCEQGLLQAKSESARAYVRAQYLFRDVVAEAFALCIDMKNEDKSSQFIGSVVGSVIGTLIANVVRNADDPEACLGKVNAVAGKALENALFGGRTDFTSAGRVAVFGESGGRA